MQRLWIRGRQHRVSGSWKRYAVRVGGGNNHRFGLFDGILIKDNHIEAVGSITEALRLASEGHHLAKIEVEVENLNDLKRGCRRRR